jgi:hypothetical protein
MSATRLTLAAATTAAALAVLAVIPASGHAAKLTFNRCDGKKYLLIRQDGDPQVKQLKIKMRNRRADGYAPRCLVAEAIAGEVQTGVISDHKRPKTVNIMGAQWGMRGVKCSYRERSGYTQVQCVKKGRDANTVRFRLQPREQ